MGYDVLFDTLYGIFTGLSLIVMLTLEISLLAFVVFFIIARVKLFKKAGIEGWKAIIPFYGTYVFYCQICEIHWGFFIAYWLLALGGFAIIVNTIIKAMVYYNLALKCHRDPAATTIFGAIVSGIVTLVYGLLFEYKYDKTVVVENCGFFNKILH